ncbi:VOC family protein [Acuticoccus sp. I52.16.1]|uniref:VOC family protein n=1 Tax=Acuticoccus sp. I52.16.1 TaxID=2928472 RepID=UPI001FD018CE|nr:VOC family protein [Acuticoccus sp. I52.16.1]UOM36505.1 VOC family protein [Acuticoccus sp. I52.16.1]
MSFAPYIHFQGNCREAMTFYAEVFGGTLEIMTFADAPAGSGMPASNRVMHATLTTPQGPLMASDFPESMEGEPQKAVSISRFEPDVETGRKTFDRLAEGGVMIMPYGETFFSPGFGMVQDRFGTHWMVMSQPPR